MSSRTLSRRIARLEQMPGNVLKKIQSGEIPPKKVWRFVATGVWGAADLSQSTCERTLHEDGTVWELVFLKNAKGEGASHRGSEEELNQWIATFPIEPSGSRRQSFLKRMPSDDEEDSIGSPVGSR